MNKLEGTLPYVGLLALFSMALTRVCDPRLTTLSSEFGVSVWQDTPAQLRELLGSEIRRWAEVITRSNVPRQ